MTDVWRLWSVADKNNRPMSRGKRNVLLDLGRTHDSATGPNERESQSFVAGSLLTLLVHILL